MQLCKVFQNLQWNISDIYWACQDRSCCKYWPVLTHLVSPEALGSRLIMASRSQLEHLRYFPPFGSQILYAHDLRKERFVWAHALEGSVLAYSEAQQKGPGGGQLLRSRQPGSSSPEEQEGRHTLPVTAPLLTPGDPQVGYYHL